MSLKISPRLLERIREHGRRDYPHECCGLLLGNVNHSVKSVISLKPVTNSRMDSPQNRYLISPHEWLEAERETRKEGLDIVGIYHSHPDHPSRPSEFDRENAFPWYSYVIVSITGGKPEDLRSWLLRDDRSEFEPEDLVCFEEGREPCQ
jgi:proteasome lid subunit RPN8/RPN11